MKYSITKKALGRCIFGSLAGSLIFMVISGSPFSLGGFLLGFVGTLVFNSKKEE